VSAALGHSGILLAFAASIAGVATIVTGLSTNRVSWLKQSAVYAYLILLGALLATAVMEHALITHDFRLVFVAENNSTHTPLLYSITGLWSALSGSLLLWGLILSIYIAAMVFRFRHRLGEKIFGWATLVTYLVSAFFFGLMVGPANPFQLVTGPTPSNGPGPNVLLQDNPLVAVHPPMLYLGFVGFTVPFAFGIAALVTGKVSDSWLVETRRWTLLAWGFLTVGIMLGAWWSYQVLGWGGFWAWDPVENAALLPWLCGTAYLHSVVLQERRGLLKVWNLSLLSATFCLTILATFLTRSGVVVSVHAFSNSNLGPELLFFFALVSVVSVALIAWRGDKLRSSQGIDSLLSREGTFLLNNVLFAAIAFVVLLGTVFPMLVQAFDGQKLTIGGPYFDTMITPLAIAILFLMGVGSVLPWRKATFPMLVSRLKIPAWIGVLTIVACVIAGLRGVDLLVAFGLAAFTISSASRQLVLAVRSASRGRGRIWRAFAGRTGGGMVAHIGVAILAIAFVSANSLAHRGQVSLYPGKSVHFSGQEITYLGTKRVVTPTRVGIEELVDVNGTLYKPAVSQYAPDTEGVATPAIATTVSHDVYLTVVSLPRHTGGQAVIGVIVEPLVLWMWVGGAIFALGIALAILPDRRGKSSVES